MQSVKVGYQARDLVVSPDGDRLYVSNQSNSNSAESQGSVSVVDTARRRVTSTVPLTGTGSGIAISSDGRYVYATESRSAVSSNRGGLAVIDTSTMSVVSTIELTPNLTPQFVAVSPDDRTVYVSESDSDRAGRIAVISAANRTVTSTIVVGAGPRRLAASRDGKRIYVANGEGKSVSVVDAEQREVLANAYVGMAPFGISVSKNSASVYVTVTGDKYSSTEHGGPPGTLVVLDSVTFERTSTIKVQRGPVAVAVSPSARRIYVANESFGAGGGNTISVLDTRDRRVVSTLPTGDGPAGLALSPDGTRLYCVILGDGSGRSTVSTYKL